MKSQHKVRKREKLAQCEFFLRKYKSRTKCETHKVKPHKVRATCISKGQQAEIVEKKISRKKVGAILTLLLFTFHFCSEDIFENNFTLNEATKFLGRWWYYRTRRTVKGDVKIGSNSVAVYTLELYVTEGERKCTTGIYECHHFYVHYTQSKLPPCVCVGILAAAGCLR